MRVLLGLVLAVAGLNEAGAEAMLVRAGEHGNYSRLVIPDAPEGWSAAANGRLLEIRLPADRSYALTDVIDRRLAHRILSARQEHSVNGALLSFRMNCACDINASVSGDGSLIIDIRDAGEQTATDETGDAGTADETPALHAAREKMIALLAEANHTGVIALKKSEPDHPHPEPPNTPPATENEKDDTDYLEQPGQCPDGSLFAASASDATLSYDDIAALQAAADDASPEDRAAAERALAEGYLRIGFLEEARSVAARSAPSIDAVFFVAIADLLTGADDTADFLSALTHCGPAFELMDAAADTKIRTRADNGYASEHFEALERLTPAIRTPLAERLALAALDGGDTELAARFYSVANATQRGPASPGMTLLASALADETSVHHTELQTLAQNPGPQQARALKAMAQDSQRTHYDGFLDDLAEFGSQQTDAQDFVVIAERLARDARVGDAFDLLARNAKNGGAPASAARSTAHALLLEGLGSGDDSNRFRALSAYTQRRAELSSREADLDAARALAEIGAADLVRSLLDLDNSPEGGERKTIYSRALLRSGRYREAAGYSPLGEAGADAYFAAFTESGDMAGFTSALTAALEAGAAPAAIADAAWRASAWPLAASVYEKVEALDARTARQAILSGLGAKQIAASAAAVKALSDPAAANALRHMFVRAPTVNAERLDRASAFARGVAAEVAFIESEIGDE